MRKIIFIIFICAGSLFIPLISHAEIFTIERAISGDIIQLSNKEKIRLIGIDAPENTPNTKARKDSKRTGQDIDTIVKMGRAATDWVKEKFKGRKVFLRFDTKKKDKRGLKLAYVYLLEGTISGGSYVHQQVKDVLSDWWDGPVDGEYTFVNGTIIANGYAQPMIESPNDQNKELFDKLYWRAKEGRRGLWNMKLPKKPCAGEGEITGGGVGLIENCCRKQGLKPMVPLMSGSECLETPDPIAVSICSRCGNKTCDEENNEDYCNCYKDCKHNK